MCAQSCGGAGRAAHRHAGTLDPMATGVLPVFVGRATRAVEFASEGEGVPGWPAPGPGHRHPGHHRHGAGGPTQWTSPWSTGGRSDALPGGHSADPPMYSAIKIQGKKLYELARKGRRWSGPQEHHHPLPDGGGADKRRRLSYPVRCSKGTYVRTLCATTSAEALGCGGTMFSLRRTMAAGFTLAQSHPWTEVWSTRTRPPC